MHQVLHAFRTPGALALIYLLPPVVIQAAHWAVTGNSAPFPGQFLYVLFGIFLVHSLVRRRLNRPEDLPL